MKTNVDIAADNFHAHLDVCPQCEQHPFELCAVGHRLLMAVGFANMAAIEPHLETQPHIETHKPKIKARFL